MSTSTSVCNDECMQLRTQTSKTADNEQVICGEGQRCWLPRRASARRKRFLLCGFVASVRAGHEEDAAIEAGNAAPSRTRSYQHAVMNIELVRRCMQTGMFSRAIHARMHAHLTYPDCHRTGRRRQRYANKDLKHTDMAGPGAGAYPWKRSYSCSDGCACRADRTGSPALPACNVTGTMAFNWLA